MRDTPPPPPLELMPDFRVEPADYHADFKDLRAVREPVFVQEQQVPLEEEWDELDPHCDHVIARVEQVQDAVRRGEAGREREPVLRPLERGEAVLERDPGTKAAGAPNGWVVQPTTSR